MTIYLFILVTKLAHAVHDNYYDHDSHNGMVSNSLKNTS